MMVSPLGPKRSICLRPPYRLPIPAARTRSVEFMGLVMATKSAPEGQGSWARFVRSRRSVVEEATMKALRPALCLLTLSALSALSALPAIAAEIPASVPYTWKSVQIVGGGFVDGFVFHPTAKDVVYARTDIGGAYRRNPQTRRWEPMLDWVPYADLNLMGVESIAADPSDP